MDVTGDELAGVVDLFGGLTRAELGEALVELAYKQREERDPEDFDDDVDAALASYHLVDVETEAADAPLLVPGPVAFPELPADAGDLPHIMDVEERHVDRERVGEAAEARFRADTARAVADGDRERMERLLDVSYELEVWAPVELGAARDRLDDALS